MQICHTLCLILILILLPCALVFEVYYTYVSCVVFRIMYEKEERERERDRGTERERERQRERERERERDRQTDRQRKNKDKDRLKYKWIHIFLILSLSLFFSFSVSWFRSLTPHPIWHPSRFVSLQIHGITCQDEHWRRITSGHVDRHPRFTPEAIRPGHHQTEVSLSSSQNPQNPLNLTPSLQVTKLTILVAIFPGSYDAWRTCVSVNASSKQTHQEIMIHTVTTDHLIKCLL